jgi:hypothetical protein
MRILQTTIAGSLPKPAWLAAPEVLWAPWRVTDDGLAEAKRDAVLVGLHRRGIPRWSRPRRTSPASSAPFSAT